MLSRALLPFEYDPGEYRYESYYLSEWFDE